MNKTIKGIIFDMDGVLTETSHQHFEAWQKLAQSLGYSLGDEIMDQVRGISRMASLDIVLEAGGKKDQFTHDEKVALATKKNDIYLDLIHAFSPENLSDGVSELLKMLKEKQFKIALASASKNAPFLLEAMGIEAYFDAVVNPASIEKGKPAPDIFLKGAELLTLSPQECVGVEDAYAGIESIKAANMKAIGIGSKDVLSNCEDVYPDIVQAKKAYFDYL